MSWKLVQLELTGMATAFGLQINEALLNWYVNNLQDLGSEQTMMALRKYAATTKLQKLPTPAQLREIIRPELNVENEAIEAAGRIVQGVSKFGYMRSQEAKVFIGELGWRVVQRYGGWEHICRNLGNTINETTFMAQARQLAKATVERGSAGLDQIAPSLDPKIAKLVDIKKIE